MKRLAAPLRPGACLQGFILVNLLKLVGKGFLGTGNCFGCSQLQLTMTNPVLKRPLVFHCSAGEADRAEASLPRLPGGTSEFCAHVQV